MRFRPILLACLLLAGSLPVATVLPAHGQPARPRLVLKDGTYQVITKYERKGDRVRFYSAERDAWEEIPADLVDWKATGEWNRQHPGIAGDSGSGTQPDISQSGGMSEAAKIDAEERAARDSEKARMPFVAPGLRLPDETGVWALDTYQGRIELIHLPQSNGDLNRAPEHSIKAAPLITSAGAREAVHVEGGSSRVQFHVDSPIFFVSLDAPPGESDEPLGHALTVDTHGAPDLRDKDSHSSPDSRYFVLRMNSSNNLRTILAQEVSRMAQPGGSVEITGMKKEILPGGRWMKLTPANPLLIGEYALVEVLSPQDVNLDVWTFGLNPRAKENGDPRMPEETTP